MKKKFEYYIKLPPSEVKSQISSAIDKEKFCIFLSSRYSGKKDFIGKIKNDKFCIHRRSYIQNLLKPIFYIEIKKIDCGSKIEAYFKVATLNKVFIIINNVVLVGLGCVFGILVGLSTLFSGSTKIISFIVISSIILGEILLVKSGYYMMNLDKKEIIKFIEKLFQNVKINVT